VVVETSGKELVCHYIVVLCLGTKLDFNLGRAALYDKESRHAVIGILDHAHAPHEPSCGAKESRPEGLPIEFEMTHKLYAVNRLAAVCHLSTALTPPRSV
jgi:hypothetical protein